ncbi:hypothetical protein [Legionella maioricensis]|uniref:EF-hand domain-containing protein n=1 Tax=Legionella maioricensis TaxID=2896528 RepID=A0A9X2CZB9_9GAMM|nr:hypothetical protein [Legionella maioricensis]MCL9683477.1 hypothetical protein [Legionella maioricensis]MCL9686776.1 hypothetical protein [Legionella maioricensis]
MNLNINGNYLAGCAQGLTSINSPPLKTMSYEQSDEVKQNFSQLSQQIPVNTAAKVAEGTANKESSNQTTDSPTDNIASLISLIESSRKIEDNLATMSQILSSLPESQGQLMLMSSDPSNTAKDGLVAELVQNFSKIDTNKDNLASYNEVLAFLNRY